MSVERLERVMWRIRAKVGSHPKPIDREIVIDAIMRECGTDDRTIYMNTKALRRLKWLRSHGKRKYVLTGVDIEESS